MLVDIGIAGYVIKPLLKYVRLRKKINAVLVPTGKQMS